MSSNLAPITEPEPRTQLEPTSYLVFVYGTLKRGHGNNILLNDSEFIGQAVTKPVYRMFDNHQAFPYLIEAPEDGYPIFGELWRVDNATLRRLDRLEGVEFGHYKRINVQLESINDVKIEDDTVNLIEIIGYAAVGRGGYERILQMPECKDGIWPRKQSALTAMHSN